MNRYTYYQNTGWTKPYPGDSKIYAPNDVPGAFIPFGRLVRRGVDAPSR